MRRSSKSTLLELLRAAEIHLAADLGVGALCDLRGLAPQPGGEGVPDAAVDGDAGALHAREHRDERHLDLR